jgi:hypothetical protein
VVIFVNEDEEDDEDEEVFFANKYDWALLKILVSLVVLLYFVLIFSLLPWSCLLWEVVYCGRPHHLPQLSFVIVLRLLYKRGVLQRLIGVLTNPLQTFGIGRIISHYSALTLKLSMKLFRKLKPSMKLFRKIKSCTRQFTTWLLTAVIEASTFLPRYYHLNDLVWQDGFLIDFLQKKLVDKWTRKFLIYSGYLFNERLVFDWVIRFYIDLIIWPTYRVTIYEFTNVASTLLATLFIFLVLFLLFSLGFVVVLLLN